MPLRDRLHALDPRSWDATDRFVAVAVLAVLLAPLIAVVKAISHDWAPTGDDATIALRSAGILDGHLPLTGMRSTAGNGEDISLSTHHLGPLQFYLLALPLALTGGAAAGIAIGGALIAAIASVLTVVWTRRLGGTLGVVVFTSGLLLAQWAIGPEAMFRPLNPYAPLLPTYLALLLLWALARGDHRALPPSSSPSRSWPRATSPSCRWPASSSWPRSRWPCGRPGTNPPARRAVAPGDGPGLVSHAPTAGPGGGRSGWASSCGCRACSSCSPTSRTTCASSCAGPPPGPVTRSVWSPGSST